MTRIHAADGSQVEVVASLVAGAFADLEVAQWLVTDRQERIRLLGGQFALLVEHAMTYGLVHTVKDSKDKDTVAAAVWFDNTTATPQPPDYSLRLQEICGPHTPLFDALDRQFERHHPTQPHHHLAFLAVQPDWQGQGLGSTLLGHHHQHLDTHHIPAYLEASSIRSLGLYQRHGYKPGEALQLPDGPTMYPMWRIPNP